MWDHRHGAPPPGYDGYMIINQDGNPVWYKESPERIAQKYIQYQKQYGPIPTLIIFPHQAPDAFLEHGIVHGIEILASNEGKMKMKLVHKDPYIHIPIDLNPLKYGLLRYEIRVLDVERNAPPSLVAQLYFHGPGQNYDESHSFQQIVSPDGKWHTISYELFTFRSWVEQTSVKGLRFDFLNHKGTIEVRNIYLVNDPKTISDWLKQNE